MTPNYIPDTNPFQLAGPPQWFLSKLWDFDNSLVIVPSRQGFYYRLAQRRKTGLTEKVAFEAMKEQADTAMMLRYGLVPVTTILATVNWSNPFLFVELENRAPWRMGGADAVNQMLEAQDRQERIDRQAKTDEHLDHLARDSWKFYNLKRGLRSSLITTKSKAPTGTLLQPNQPKPYKPLVTTAWGRPERS